MQCGRRELRGVEPIEHTARSDRGGDAQPTRESSATTDTARRGATVGAPVRARDGNQGGTPSERQHPIRRQRNMAAAPASDRRQRGRRGRGAVAARQGTESAGGLRAIRTGMPGPARGRRDDHGRRDHAGSRGDPRRRRPRVYRTSSIRSISSWATCSRSRPRRPTGAARRSCPAQSAAQPRVRSADVAALAASAASPTSTETWAWSN